MKDIEGTHKIVLSLDEAKLLKPILDNIISLRNLSASDLNVLKRKYKCNHKNSTLLQAYNILNAHDDIANFPQMSDVLMIKQCKSWSGITSITVFTSPYPEYTNDNGEKVVQSFSCQKNCHFCPNQPGQVRSYILDEPGVARANANKYICVDQMYNRMDALCSIGHIDLGKLEILVLGGTFSSYPDEYRIEFIRDIYFAANTYWDRRRIERFTLEKEIEINTTTKSRVIGLTIETRGDSITFQELTLFRRMGCTRIQMGIQHTDDNILNFNNRQCSTATTKRAIQMCKELGFKLDGHLMFNLPSSTIEKDTKMLMVDIIGLAQGHIVPQRKGNNEKWTMYDPMIQVDQLKLYPTAVTDYTKIKEWFENGSYVPYAEDLLKELIIRFKIQVPHWIRLNRIIRDFYAHAVYSESGGNLGLRDEIQREMDKCGLICRCIRCREVKNKSWDGNYELYICEYNASNGREFFISAENKQRTILYGFVRLRLDNAQNKFFTELNGAALIRELHVYSQLTNVGTKGKHVQHKGLGTALMKKAEEIGIANKYYKFAVISGVGARTFYERIGYKLDKGLGQYMMKKQFSFLRYFMS